MLVECDQKILRNMAEINIFTLDHWFRYPSVNLFIRMDIIIFATCEVSAYIDSFLFASYSISSGLPISKYFVNSELFNWFKSYSTLVLNNIVQYLVVYPYMEFRTPCKPFGYII